MLEQQKQPYTREQLIDICEKSFVLEDMWADRDSAEAQMQVGSCLALLKAGCEFIIFNKGESKTDEKTIWLEIHYKGLNYFEYSDEGAIDAKDFYLPTPETLEKVQGGDWY